MGPTFEGLSFIYGHFYRSCVVGRCAVFKLFLTHFCGCRYSIVVLSGFQLYQNSRDRTDPLHRLRAPRQADGSPCPLSVPNTDISNRHRLFSDFAPFYEPHPQKLSRLCLTEGVHWTHLK